MRSITELMLLQLEELSEIELLFVLNHKVSKLEDSLLQLTNKTNIIMATISDLTTANGLLIQKADALDAKADTLSDGLDKVLAIIGNTNISAADQKLIDDAVTATQADADKQDAEAAKLDTEIAKIPA